MTSEPNASSPQRPLAGCLDGPTIDQLLSLDDGATGLLAELYGLFQEDSPSRLDGMERAIAGGDAQSTAELAHALKGAAGTIGAGRMRAIAQEIEKAGKAGTVGPDTAARLTELREAYAEACAALDAYLAAG